MSRMRLAALLLSGALLAASCSADGDAAPGDAAPPILSLEGSFQARIGWKEFKSFEDLEVPRTFAGDWTITFGDGSYRLEGTGFRVTEKVVPQATGFDINATPAPTGAYNCFDGRRRLVGDGDAAGSYTVDERSGAIDLAPAEDPCPFRELLLTRSWSAVTG